MNWGEFLQPNLILGSSILDLNPELLKQHGLQGLILDVDETLVPFNQADASAELQQWMAGIKPIAKVILLSNNLYQTRIARIAKSLDLPYFHGAGKPSRRKLRQAVAQMQLPPERIAMVGDRVFTDVLAGNRLGMFTILVEPLHTIGETERRLDLRNLEIWISQRLRALRVKP
jgi:hypothetical protein